MTKSTKKKTPQHTRVKQMDPRVGKPVPESPVEMYPRGPSPALRAKTEEVYVRKQLRRRISSDFEEMRRSGAQARSADAAAFLGRHSSDLELVREALVQYKAVDDSWAVAVWEWLSESDVVIVEELRRLQDDRQYSRIRDARLLISQPGSEGIRVMVPTTSRGPSWSAVTPEAILSQVRSMAGDDELDLALVEFRQFDRAGAHSVMISLGQGETVAVRVNVELERGEPPEAVSQAWRSVPELPTEPGASLLDALGEYLDHTATDPDNATALLRVLKTAYGAGYWKHEWTLGILERWEHLSESMHSERRLNGVPGQTVSASVAVSAKEDLVAREVAELDMWVLEKPEDARRLRILNLPPLVAYDLCTTRVDLTLLKPLLLARQLDHLVDGKLEDLSDSDIRRMAFGINDALYELKRSGGKPLGARNLANIPLMVARLEFDRLDIDTSADSIRFCLSAYGTRMGEYLIQQHHRYDVARDYYLEAASLNLVSRRGVDFPTNLLFKSLFPDAGTPPVSQANPDDYLALFERQQYQSQPILETAARSFLELGARHISWASTWFEASPDSVRHKLLSLIQRQLHLAPETDFAGCVNAYVQPVTRFAAILEQMGGCTSEYSIIEVSAEFAELRGELGFLISPTNHEIAERLIRAAESVRGSLGQELYEKKRNYYRSTLSLLDQVLAYQHDNRTALWATHFRPTAIKWLEVIRRQLASMTQEVSPIIDVALAEPNLSLTDTQLNGGHVRAIVRLANSGAGTADRLNVRLTTQDEQSFHLITRDIRLEPKETRETYFEVGTDAQLAPREYRYTVTYYDPDRAFVERTGDRPLTVGPLPCDPGLTELLNPFNPGPEVTDEPMFVGRDLKLQQVVEAANESGLIMLHGQKRVGKSSFLIFLERRLDGDSSVGDRLAVRVSWTNYTAHPAFAVMEEIAHEVCSKLSTRFRHTLEVPDRSEFRTSYTLATNDLLRALERAGVGRLVLMVDEFDAIVGQLKRSELGFDRAFFEYLRGLSKRPNVTLVLTGGEMMPVLFEQLGDVFNHNRPWRIDYLSRSDGSVERLVRNEYVKGVLTFSDDAIETIKEISACNPFFVQMVCKEMVDAAKRERSAHLCKLDVHETVEWLVHRGGLDSKSVRHLYSPFGEPDPLDMAIIGLVSEHEVGERHPRYVTEDEIVARIDPRQHDKAVTRIGELVRREVLRGNPTNGREVRMMLPLFRDWFNDNKPEYRLWAPLLQR